PFLMLTLLILVLMLRRPPLSTLFPYTTLFRSSLRQIPPRAMEEARLRRAVTLAENVYTNLKQRYEEARLADASTIPDVRILDSADRKSTRLNSSHQIISYAVFCLKKKKKKKQT